MHVKELMSKEVQTCRSSDSLNEPARTMWEADIGCVPVLDAADRVVGVVTDRDICMASYTQGLPLTAIPVTSAMSPNVVACQSTDTVETAARLLQQHRIHRLPVIDGGRLVGVVSLNDLARLAAAEGGRRGARPGTYAVTEMLASICEPRWARTPPAAFVPRRPAAAFGSKPPADVRLARASGSDD